MQHALRAYTPKEQKAVKTAAETFRANPKFKTVDVITELGTGEALVSFLDEKGRPGVAERAFILPPRSYLGQISEGDYRAMIYGSELDERYRERIDDYTAYEAIGEAEEKAGAVKAKAAAGSKTKTAAKRTATTRKRKSYAEKATDRMVGNAASAIGRGLGNMLSKKLFR